MRRARRWRLLGSSFVAVAAASLAGLLSSPAPAGATPSQVTAFMTLYGYADNSPPGTDIAHPCIHQEGAGGVGTYDDPVTFATDVAELPWCTVIYVPYMRRYFVHEDECSQCDTDWTDYGLYRFDMWAGGDASSTHEPEKRALLRCESTWTRANSISDPNNPQVEIDPPSDLPVTTAPIFTYSPTSPTKGCWPGAVVVTNPGRQQSTAGTALVVQVQAQSTVSPAQTLWYTATNLPPGLSIDAATGTISGVPSSTGRHKVTVTVSDSVDSASATFTWAVKRG